MKTDTRVIRRSLIAATLIWGVVGNGIAASPAPHFAASSFWYQPIPADVALHPGSATFVAEFLRQKAAYYGTVGINTTSFSSPVYVVGGDVPTTTVKQWDCQNKGLPDAGLSKQWAAVPIPAYAVPAVGSDSEMTVYQPSTDTLWEFWRMRNNSGTWEACWGGGMQKLSISNGIWPLYYGATATGLPFAGGQITAEELQAGEIRHAIGIALVDADAPSQLSWPALRSDGFNPNGVPGRIPEGIRFRLDPAVNVDALNLHPVARIIAKAAQKYGFVFWDKAGAITVRFENPIGYTAQGLPDPYPALLGTTPRYAVLNGFPWDRLQFLPLNYGRP